MKKNIIITLSVVAVLGLIAFKLMSNKEKNEAKTAIVAQKNNAVSVKTAIVATQQMELDFSVNGNFEPIQELNYAAEKSGKITSVLVKEGDYVHVGQTLAVMKADLINVEVQTAETAYQTSQTDYNRFENAYKTGGVTKQQLDQAKMGLVNAQARLKQAKINSGDSRVKAPINGFINKRLIEPGSIVAAMPPTTLFNIVNVSKLKLKVNVSENQVAGLRVGNKIAVKASVYPDQDFSGKITFIAPIADSSLNFPVEIEITNNNSNDLKAGMYGTALFTSNKQKQSLMIVPRNAFLGSVSSNQVFVNENGIAKLKTVTAGRILDDKVEIIKGLSNGDQVITTGQINLTDGTAIEVIK